jgi:GT2 family glycosyltransferase
MFVESSPGQLASVSSPGAGSGQSDSERPRVRGKFLYVGEEKLWVKGVTYGTFRPDETGNEYECPAVVGPDFAEIARHGFNAIRTYSVPPRWLLDLAEHHGLRVMVGLPWEQHIAFLDDRGRARSIEHRVRAGVRACAGHPAVLCYVIGNEIPAPIVRWHGRRRIERFLERLYRAAHAEDAGALVTYVNYPTTEYLELPFLDLVSFNVYLESQERLEAYLARLQNLAGERPLVMAEIGLDSRRHREDGQARGLEWQVRATFAAGCAGAFVFAWTDEWYRGGHDIDDWDFGLTGRDRKPKPALSTVREAFAELPFPKDRAWPHISVVVCSYNGAQTIRDCFDGLKRLEYPDYEVIVVNDGSNDHTAAIARQYGFRLISTPNRGLSSARNTGLAAARGEIVAYLDDDAYPDPHWLTYMAAMFLSTEHAGVGGPNIPPPGDGAIAECVANAPGGPVHVLLSDQVAEHIPGCNMAFRKAALEAIGGFDPQFRTAGDDVDVCWRLQERGWTLGFSPAAMVWHHRRNSVRAYWKQQQGYGKAEALLERKWPEKYNAAGHITWAGRLYGNGWTRALGWRRGRIYQGSWGSALFQSVYEPTAGTLLSLPLMPEWYLVVAALAGLSALGLLWAPLLLALPLLAVAVAALLAQACLSGAGASFRGAHHSPVARAARQGLTAFLHLIQPLARLQGRRRHGLTPWRRKSGTAVALPWPRTVSIWSEHWQDASARLGSIEAQLRADGAVVRRGGDYNRWDLEVRGGALGAARLRMAIEEHGTGKQFVRLRAWPRYSRFGLGLTILLAALSAGAGLDHAWAACLILGLMAGLLGLRTVLESAAALGAVLRAARGAGSREA